MARIPPRFYSEGVAPMDYDVSPKLLRAVSGWEKSVAAIRIQPRFFRASSKASWRAL
jgi:hypothetical protein